jgi:hypothetical protein
VAQEIASNPPAALVTIVTPRGDVGGFSDRRRGPDEDGGGAPCPSEFLLHRAKRANQQNDPNPSGGDAPRNHPNEAKSPQPSEASPPPSVNTPQELQEPAAVCLRTNDRPVVEQALEGRLWVFRSGCRTCDVCMDLSEFRRLRSRRTNDMSSKRTANTSNASSSCAEQE